MNVKVQPVTVIKTVTTLKAHSSVVAMMATLWTVMRQTALTLMNAHWEHTTVSNCVSTLMEGLTANVNLVTNSTMMVPDHTA